MSIAAFYRTYVPFVRTYSYYSEGNNVEVQTPPTWVKINLQPFKQGVQLDAAATGNIYKNWKTAYVRAIPVYDLMQSSGLSSGLLPPYQTHQRQQEWLHRFLYRQL